MPRRITEVVSTISNLTRRFLAISTDRAIVKHCLHAHEAASGYTVEDINLVGQNKFEVCSERHRSTWYTVHLGSPGRLPSCQCWAFSSSNLPCKHFFAIFKNTSRSHTRLSRQSIHDLGHGCNLPASRQCCSCPTNK